LTPQSLVKALIYVFLVSTELVLLFFDKAQNPIQRPELRLTEASQFYTRSQDSILKVQKKLINTKEIYNILTAHTKAHCKPGIALEIRD
jgi:hypothetical protein